MAAYDGQVYLFYHQKDRDSSRRLRDRVADQCAERNWRFSPTPFQPHRNPCGRLIPLIQADVASGLYRLCHRTRIATLVLSADPRVPLHPRVHDALRYNRHMPLRRFVAYKCCWYKLPSEDADDTWAGVFRGWCGRVECENERDPRCLPFHVFDGQGQDLDTATGLTRFDGKYGTSDRVDESRTSWRLNPRDYHGQETLAVAGCSLPTGAHWDVLPLSKRIFYAPGGVWDIQGHCNVYPDAHFRSGSGRFKKLE